MLANFVIRVHDPVESTAMPANGVVREADGTMTAWVTTDRHHFVQRIIKTGLRKDGQVQILDGLQRGELAVSGRRRVPQQYAAGAAKRLDRMPVHSRKDEQAMFKSLIAFCLSRRPIVVVGLLLVCRRRVHCLQDAQHRGVSRTRRPSSWKLPRRRRASPPRRWNATTRIPMEIGLYTTPGIDVIRSTSFYGLSFVRVSFKYGVDYYFAYAQASVAMQQNVSLPGSLVPTIQANSSTGEIYRYQVVGPKHFGITNLRTVQDWIVARRLLTIPGIAAVNSWGGPTKEFQVEVDPHKLEAYSVTVPQILTALGNANINVGGREIRIGQQSINIRGVGLIDDGGNDDLTQGYKVDDIENVVLTQDNGVPVLVKDVGKVSVGYRPRLGILGRDQQDDVVGVDRGDAANGKDRRHDSQGQSGNRQAESRRESAAGSQGCSLLRPLLADRHHHAHGSAQPDFRMPAGLPDPMDFPRQSPQRDHRWLEHPVRAVLRHHSAGDYGRKREPAFRGRGGFRHHRGFGGDPGREYLPEFSARPGRKTGSAAASGGGCLGARPDADPRKQASVRSRMDGSLAADSDQRACRWTRRFCSRRSSRWPDSCRFSPCRESRGRFSAPWRAPTATRWPEP